MRHQCIYTVTRPVTPPSPLLWSTLIFVIALLAFPALSEEAAHKAVPTPGMWEITYSTEDTGGKPTTFVMKQCMQADELGAQMPYGKQADGTGDFSMQSDGCKMQGSGKGNRYEMTTDCDGQKTKITMETGSDSYIMVMETSSKGASQKITTVGKRVGDCQS